MREEALERCQQAIDYQFKDPDLLASALTHASIAQDRLDSNERMEFLGDSVLGVVVCEYLYSTYPEQLEGSLTKIKSAVVSGKTCAEISEELGLGDCLFLGNGISLRAKLPMSVTAAVFESLIAALYLDAGFEHTRAFILRFRIQRKPARGDSPYVSPAHRPFPENSHWGVRSDRSCERPRPKAE